MPFDKEKDLLLLQILPRGDKKEKAAHTIPEKTEQERERYAQIDRGLPKKRFVDESRFANGGKL